MRLPLLLKVYRTLRRGWKHLTPDAQHAVAAFVASQRRADGYLNAGGTVDDYYTQFGRVLEAVMTPLPWQLLRGLHLGVRQHRQSDDVYGVFFRFIADEWRPWRRLTIEAKPMKTMMSNGVCCLMAMQHQQGRTADPALRDWLLRRQSETGGFHASELAPVPDLLTTAVALFTLLLIGVRPQHPAADFIEAHWLDEGAFAPTIMDHYSDVEYLFYGLLALGSTCTTY